MRPAAWGAVGGAIAAIIIGFAWGGWVTGGAARQMETVSAKDAVVQAFTPLCVARAEREPEQLLALKEQSSWKRGQFVVDAGWVDNVSENHRLDVAKACALTVIEGMDAG